MIELCLLFGAISATILGGMAIHGVTDKGYGEGNMSSLDRMILAWKEDRKAKRELEREALKDARDAEKRKMKFLESHIED